MCFRHALYPRHANILLTSQCHTNEPSSSSFMATKLPSLSRYPPMTKDPSSATATAVAISSSEVPSWQIGIHAHIILVDETGKLAHQASVRRRKCRGTCTPHSSALPDRIGAVQQTPFLNINVVTELADGYMLVRQCSGRTVQRLRRRPGNTTLR